MTVTKAWLCFFLVLLLLIVSAPQATMTSQVENDSDSGKAGHDSLKVIISEFLPKAIDDAFLDEDGERSDWVELFNLSNTTISLKGWSLVNGLVDTITWEFPAMSIAPGEYLVVMASDEDRREPSGQFLHTNFKLKKEGTEYLALISENGKIEWEHNPAETYVDETPPGLPEGLSMGSSPEKQRAGDYTAVPLLHPTPGAVNAPELYPDSMLVELFSEVSTTIIPQGNASSQIHVWASINMSEITPTVDKVELIYSVGLSASRTVEMSVKSGLDNISGIEIVNFTSIVPQLMRSGTLLRWNIRGTDFSGSVFCSPVDCSRSYGWVGDGALYSGIPELHMWAESPGKAMSASGEKDCVVYLAPGPVLEGVRIRRRGKSSKVWQKPKLKLDFKDAADTEGGAPHVREINLQSFYMEPGEVTYLRETASLSAMREAGVTTPLAYHVCVYLNGQFLGLFAVVEEVDDDFLELPPPVAYQRNSLDGGPLFKSVHGQLSNYRHDAEYAMGWAYSPLNPAAESESAKQKLQELTWGLAGGSVNLTRSQSLYVTLNLPQVINEMAMQTTLHNIDRCTKNFISYFDEPTQRWGRIPWDMDSALAIDRNFGGEPYPDYCILACPQWNSPMYCDRDHPQDLVGYWSNVKDDEEAQANIARGMPESVWEDPDSNRTAWESITGAAGTYNHLIDAILDVPGTRSMYLRRLQVLTDIFHTNGRLREIVTEQFSQIYDVARQDHILWGAGDPSLGYRQLMEEQLPERQAQLLETYGAGGTEPILPPPAQYGPGSLEITLGSLNSGAACILKVTSTDATQALDLSKWSVAVTNQAEQTTVTAYLDLGTVLPPQGVVLLGHNDLLASGEIRQLQVEELQGLNCLTTGVLIHGTDLIDSQLCQKGPLSLALTDENGLKIASGSFP